VLFRSETDIREAIQRFTSENRRTLRINIDGIVIRLEPGHAYHFDNWENNRKVIMTGGITIDA